MVSRLFVTVSARDNIPTENEEIKALVVHCLISCVVHSVLYPGYHRKLHDVGDVSGVPNRRPTTAPVIP